MIVSFPYMGCVTGYKKMFELLGHDIIMPKKPTQGTVDLGVKYSPEFICFPFKVMLGTYLEAAKAGAKVFVVSGGHGPCRAGYYAEIHSRIMKSLGYDVEFIVFDSIFRDFKGFIKNLIKIKNKTPIIRALIKGIFVFRLIMQMDNIEKEIKINRAYEINHGEYNQVWAEIVRLYELAYNSSDLKKAKIASRKLLDQIPRREVKEKDRIRVGIVGEIYVVMESSTNMDIEQVLNNLGIEVENVQYISSWVLHNIQPRWLKLGRSNKVIEKAKCYCFMNCGGHDMENIGWMIDFKQRGFDGIVHLMPFACLPELINQSRIPNISHDLDIPILSLSLDEQLGAAHNMTRVEAFVDLIAAEKGVKRTPITQEPDENIDMAINKPLAHIH